MKKFTEISARLVHLIDYLDISKSKFAHTLGYNRPQAIYDMINGKAYPSYDFFKKFLNTEYSVNISLRWLITGEGEMLLKDQGGKPPPATKSDDECKQEVEFYKRLLKEKEAELKQAYMDMGKLQEKYQAKKESTYSDRTESFSKLTHKGEKTNEKSQS